MTAGTLPATSLVSQCHGICSLGRLRLQKIYVHNYYEELCCPEHLGARCWTSCNEIVPGAQTFAGTHTPWPVREKCACARVSPKERPEFAERAPCSPCIVGIVVFALCQQLIDCNCDLDGQYLSVLRIPILIPILILILILTPRQPCAADRLCRIGVGCCCCPGQSTFHPMFPLEATPEEWIEYDSLQLDVSQQARAGLSPMSWSPLHLGMMHHDPIMQILAQEESKADEQKRMLWPHLPLVLTQHASEDRYMWEEVHQMLLVVKNLEAEADVRMERARRYGEQLRLNAQRIIIISESIPLGLRTRLPNEHPGLGTFFGLERIEAKIDEFVNGRK